MFGFLKPLHLEAIRFGENALWFHDKIECFDFLQTWYVLGLLVSKSFLTEQSANFRNQYMSYKDRTNNPKVYKVGWSRVEWAGPMHMGHTPTLQMGILQYEIGT